MRIGDDLKHAQWLITIDGVVGEQVGRALVRSQPPVAYIKSAQSLVVGGLGSTEHNNNNNNNGENKCQK